MPRDNRAPTHRRTLPYPTVTSPSTPTPYTPFIHPRRPLTPPPTNNERRPSNAWSTQQDEMLMQARLQGKNWGPISKLFPDKSSNACRKRHERLQANRRDADEWDPAKMEALAKAYSSVRRPMWQMLADQMDGENWTTIETKCMERGFRNLVNLGKTAMRRERNHQKAYSSDAEDDSCSRSHPNSDDGFNDSAIGPDEHHGVRNPEDAAHPHHFYITPTQPRRSSHPPSGDHTPPSHYGGARSWSSSTSSISPVSVPAPIIRFPSELNSSSPSSRHKLPSFNESFPSITTVMETSPPVTTRG